MSKITVQQIAKMIDHSILHPTFTDQDLIDNCQVANKFDVATVCVKPYHTKMAAELLKDSNVEICAVIGFPHGNSTTEIKSAETLQVIKDGATEVDMVVNIGKVLQGDWDFVEKEIQELNDICVQHNAKLKVIFETDFVTREKDIIKLCEICSKHKVAFVKTSTGYGFVKGEDGRYDYSGATVDNLRLMRKYSAPSVEIKAAGGIRNLDQLLAAREAGATRVGATASKEILEEAKSRFGL